MKSRLFFMFHILMVLLTGCQGTTESVVSMTPTPPVATSTPYTADSDMLEGEWKHECDILGTNWFRWESKPMKFEYAEMIAELSFSDWDVRETPSNLAFIIRSTKPEYRYNWLYTKKTGELDPDISYFNKYGPMEEYPGGYSAFEKELINKGIDWAAMYKKVRVEFLIQYLLLDQNCPPYQERRTPLPGEKNA